ncbi:DUF4296 domain-containing protein [Tenacibaculum caenipelagi]|uniref:Uncharacterized protein DUF4296 n=1 Tax=Tenacibaculum caenipelagi TaxID=1325435 RepID=A0A4R6TL57_9FLAO|nr:DUF4296 domain-containing protein [Tenacibaculum caenipelagi]TDQ28891.1 uncharacterized protein DUF4296 [Tenacibaculum caenipelagi]
MKAVSYILISLLLVSCTSNTIYKKPKNLIPKDSMVALLTDMYIASSAKNQKNKFLKREKNYVFLVYEKYKIDSTRFDISNTYYTSKIEEYTEILKKVKSNIDSLEVLYREENLIQDSLKGLTKKSRIKKDSVRKEEIELREIPERLIEEKEEMLNKKALDVKKR